MKRIQTLSTITLLLFLHGCGKGVDAKLETHNEQAYRKSLNSAWQDMSADQQNAFNWAVSNLTLDQLIAKYPSMTPKTVITSEADEYIQLKTRETAEISAALAKDANRLAQEAQLLSDIDAELSKISAKGISISNSVGFGKEFIFTTTNGSEYDISSATWDAWLFIDSEERSDRHCRIHAYYKTRGGMPSGRTVKHSFEVGFMNCENWDTLEVRNARTKHFKLQLDFDSIENFAEKKVRPRFSTTRATYEEKIKAATHEIETAVKAKATLR